MYKNELNLLRIPSPCDQLPLALAIMEPSGPAVGIVQLVHGMAEHKERYFDFMTFLAAHGYISAIHDHRGHGESVRDPAHLGYFYTEDASALVDDVFQVTAYLKDHYGPLPLSLFSHSMGTLVARNYLKKYEAEVDRVVLCGPPTENKWVDLALLLAKGTGLCYGPYQPNSFLNRLSVGPYNTGYAGKNEWICSDPAVVAAYNADPLCGFLFTTNGYLHLFQLLKQAFQRQNWHPQNRALPILLIAGEEDPVIQSQRKWMALKQFLRSVGYTHLTSKRYPGKRHELLNEIGKEAIYQDVLAFLRSEDVGRI